VISDAVDGVSRVYSLRRLASFPLIVAVGLSLDDELAESRTHIILEIGIGVAASVLLAALNLLLVREIRRRRQRETELALEHTALETARTELLIEQGKLAAVNQELIYSTEQAEAANLAKSQFLAQMSHELRTPLHAVIGFSELISHHVTPMPASREIAGYANDIMKSGRHLLALINSILDLSKVESGTARLAEDDVPLDEVVQDSLTTISQLAVAANVAIETSLPEEMPIVRGDATKLRQIFINLLSNAVKFTPQGGSVTVLGRNEQDRGFAVIVADTGIGMTEAEVAIALEPFGQVENSLARSFEGTGLGLPLARRMTELHDGRLTVRSVKGVGTTVEVYLPPGRILWPDGARKPKDAPVASER
jgi:two-component system, cell cycle sensor histidine kinase PleC